jgi:predicted lipid-binding transport protein (Tim44 family)
MTPSIIQLLVLGGIAVFLILRLRSVLGTREGFEKPAALPADKRPRAPQLELVDGRADRDVTDHVPEDSDAARALLAMKAADPSFNVREFLAGARQAYEMILLAFERGDLSRSRPSSPPTSTTPSRAWSRSAPRRASRSRRPSWA